MQPTSLTIIGATLAAASAWAAGARAELVDTREIQETIRVPPAAPLVVIVKNVSGPIRVIGHDRDSVEMHASEMVRGDLRADIDRARAEFALVTEQEPGRIAFRVRRTGTDGSHERGNPWDGYRLEYDIEVKVPRGAAIELSTVNSGAVMAEGVHGDFALANVNGTVRLVGARGGGSISTVNGDVEASFEGVPNKAIALRTVNGELDVTYPAALAASFEFNTMNGDVFTDFDVVALDEPARIEPSDKRGGLRMRGQRHSSFRVGAGGAHHSFQTLNGNVYVRRAKP
jgi:hypothetical protein